MKHSAGTSDNVVTLNQRSGFQTETFELQDEGIHLRIKGPGVSNELDIAYASLPARYSKRSYPRNWLKSAGFFCLLGAVVPFGVIVALSEEFKWAKDHFTHLSIGLALAVILLELGLAYIYFMRRVEVILYVSENMHLVINSSKPSKAAVEQFLAAMNEKKKQYLLRRIRRLAELDASFQTGGALAGLLNGGIITEAQCKQLEEELKSENNSAFFGFAGAKAQSSEPSQSASPTI